MPTTDTTFQITSNETIQLHIQYHWVNVKINGTASDINLFVACSTQLEWMCCGLLLEVTSK